MLIETVALDLGYYKRAGKGLSWSKGLSLSALKDCLEQVYRSGDFTDTTPPTRSGDWSILAEYWSRLYRMNAIDFGQIIDQANRLLRDNPDLLAILRNRYKYVFIDEMHDVNLQDHELVGRFDGGTFFGVADFRQTIYSFRGAAPNYVLEQHRDADVVHLSECFRCGDAIVTAANTLIEHNHEPFAEPVIGATGRRGAVKTFHGRSDDIIKEIQAAHNQEGFAWGQIAVLARNHRALRRLGDLMGDEVPHHRTGERYDICSTEPFMAVHAFLKLLLNPRDEVAFLRACRTLGISRHGYNEALSTAIQQREPIFTAAIQTGSFPLPPMHPETLDMAEALPMALAWLNFTFDCEKAASWWSRHCGGMTIEQALSWFAHRDQQDDLAIGDKVSLLTAHAAKGLEWSCVFVVGLNDGEWPSARSLRQDEEKEERRLCFVAMTRASEALYLHYRAAQDHAEGRKINPPSRFLFESGALQ
jgi:superfamily I DNA/RNA helicase